jgi:hypothetical protein
MPIYAGLWASLSPPALSKGCSLKALTPHGHTAFHSHSSGSGRYRSLLVWRWPLSHLGKAVQELFEAGIANQSQLQVVGP